MRILNTQAAEHVGETITVKGWLHKKRLLGGLTFINVRDRSGLIQVVIKNKDEVEKLRGMQVGTVLEVTGLVKEEPVNCFNYSEATSPPRSVLMTLTDSSIRAVSIEFCKSNAVLSSTTRRVALIACPTKKQMSKNSLGMQNYTCRRHEALPASSLRTI